MKRILFASFFAVLLICSFFVSPFVYAQLQKEESRTLSDFEISASKERNDSYIKIAQPERTIATFGNGKSAMTLLDGNTSSGYQLMELGENCTVTLDFGNVYKVARVCVFTYNENYSFQLESSLDGITYLPLSQNSIGKNYSSETGYVLDVAVRECRYLRLTGLEGQFGYFSLYEVEVYADFSAENPLTEVSLPGYAEVSLDNGSGAAVLLDGKYSGSYQMIPEGENCYAVLDLKQPYAVREINVCTYDPNYRFRVEGSLDGISYLSLGENIPGEGYDLEKGYSLRLATGAYRYIRLVGLEGRYGFFTLYEIDVLADLTPAQPLPDSQLHEISLSDYADVTAKNGSKLPLLIDGKYTGAYQMLPEGENCCITIAFPEAYTIQKVTVYTYQQGYGFTLEGSLDGVHYQPLGLNDLTQEYDSGKGYSVTVTEGTYRYLRVCGTVCPYNFFSLYEIDVFATVPVPQKGDLDRNALFNIADLNLMLTALSTAEYLPYGDLDENGVLNVADLNQLLIMLSTKK